MTPGPLPIPTEIQEMMGNPGKKSQQQLDTVKAPPGKPNCPAFLDPVAKKHFKRLSKELLAMGILSKADDVLAMYCQLYSRWERAEKKVQEMGELVNGPTGTLIWNQWLSVATNAIKLMKPLSEMMGLSAAARARLHLDPSLSKSEKKEIDEFLTGDDPPVIKLAQ